MGEACVMPHPTSCYVLPHKSKLEMLSSFTDSESDIAECQATFFGVRVAAIPLSLPRTKLVESAPVGCDCGRESCVAATRTPNAPRIRTLNTICGCTAPPGSGLG
jgi:hypothetical protein